MSPATAGPARSAEKAMLASILSLLIDMGGCGDSVGIRGWVWVSVARGDKRWYTEREGTIRQIIHTRSSINSREQ
jgi:hypothetical protein